MIKRNLIRMAMVLSVICLMQPLNSFAQTQTNTQVAQKFDEFGDILLTDLKARLDNFAIQLQQQPGTRGFVISYRSHRDLPGLSSRLLAPIKYYMINTRGIAPDRLVIMDGGEADCLGYELWIVPVGKTPTPRSGAYSRDFIDKTSAWKFDEYYYPLPSDDLEDYEYVGTSLEAFAEALRKQPRAQGYILAYPEYYEKRVDPLGTASKMLRSVRAVLINRYRVPASRIKVMNGGYRKRRQVELWIVPRGEHPPIATPNAFPKRRR